MGERPHFSHYENNETSQLTRMPTIAKSESPNVVLSKPKFPNSGSNKAGKKLIRIPLAIDPRIET